MDDIVKLIVSSPTEAITLLTSDSKDPTRLKNLQQEFDLLDRKIRKTQVGQIQKVKQVNDKTVEPVSVPIGLQNKIVKTSMAFEVGEAPTISPNEKNDLSDEILRIWKANRIDHLLQKMITLKKSQLQCALLFKITNIEPRSLLNRIIGPNPNREIKSQLLQNKNGKMTPYFDSAGDMKYFVWEFSTKTIDGKDQKNAWIYDDKFVYIIDESSGTFAFSKKELHGFSKIPIVYIDQEFEEWHIAQHLIDRIEVTISKLGASNDYCGHPILKIFGELESAPDKNEDGKAFKMAMYEDEDSGKVSKLGDVEYLTYDQAPEAIELEIEQLKQFIYSTTSTPDWSFENLKGMGNALSGKAFKMMLIDPIMKAKMNEGENRTMIHRILNVITSGVITTTVTKYQRFTDQNTFDITFNSIIPNDFEDSVDSFVKATEAKILSKKRAIELLDVGDTESEIQQIKAEGEPEEPNTPPEPPAQQ